MPAAPFTALPGVCREEAINLLRRFYMQENPHAPDAKKKMRRGLKLLELPKGPALARTAKGGAASGAARNTPPKKNGDATAAPTAKTFAPRLDEQPPQKAARLEDGPSQR